MVEVSPDLMVDRAARHGWYVLFRGEGHGPVSLERLLSFPQSEGMYVSRRGFDRWYPYKEFTQLFLGLSRLKVPMEEGELSNAPVVESKRLGPNPKRNDVWVQTPSFENFKEGEWVAGAARGHVRDETRKKRYKKGLFGFAQDCFGKFASLRIGRLRELGLFDAVMVVLSCGLYFAYWYGTARRDVRSHIGKSARLPYYPSLFCLIPVFHFWAIYELAELVTKMERENGYQSIWPGLAILYGVFPPLAMFYIQGAINRHWQAHMMHELRMLTEPL